MKSSTKSSTTFLIILTLIISVGIVVVGCQNEQADDQATLLQSTLTLFPTTHFTATLLSPDHRLSLPVECTQSHSGAAGPKCYVVFSNGAKMEIQGVALPDEQSRGDVSADWSADGKFVVNCVMSEGVCNGHQIWNMAEGINLDFWLPGLAMTWWSPTGHTLVYVRDIMATPIDWGVLDVQTGEVMLPDQCPTWLLEYAESKDGQAAQADFLCDKVSQLPTATLSTSPTPTPTLWPLQVEIGKWSRQVSREKLLELTPGESTLQDTIALIGYPSARADFPSGVVLRYASEVGKLPHTVLVDGITGKVLLVSIYDFHKNFVYLSDLSYKYGEPVLADTIYTRDHLFFPDAGIALITDDEDNNDIWYLQLLPKETTLDDYRAHQGYWLETFAFTP